MRRDRKFTGEGFRWEDKRLMGLWLLFQGLEIVFRVGLALLQVNQTELMQLDMEGMSQVGRMAGKMQLSLLEVTGTGNLPM